MSVTQRTAAPPAPNAREEALQRAGLALRGVAALVLGGFSLYRPGTVTTLIVVFSIFAIVDGIVRIVVALRSSGRDKVWYIHALEGVVGIVAGFVIIRLVHTIVSWTWTVAEWAFAIGALTIVFAAVAWNRLPDAWLWVLGGIFAIAFAIALLWDTVGGLFAPGIVVGVFALLYGVLSIIIAIRKPQLS